MKIATYQHETIVQAETSREAFELEYYVVGLLIKEGYQQMRAGTKAGKEFLALIQGD